MSDRIPEKPRKAAFKAHVIGARTDDRKAAARNGQAAKTLGKKGLLPGDPTTWPKEIGGPKGPEPTRYGDWERKGICSDF